MIDTFYRGRTLFHKGIHNANYEMFKELKN